MELNRISKPPLHVFTLIFVELARCLSHFHQVMKTKVELFKEKENSLNMCFKCLSLLKKSNLIVILNKILL